MKKENKSDKKRFTYDSSKGLSVVSTEKKSNKDKDGKK